MPRFTFALVVAIMATTIDVSGAYNWGVKSVCFHSTPDYCPEDSALPCTPDAGIGESNVLRITQSKVDGYYQFNGFETTSMDQDSIWISASIEAECRVGFHFDKVQIDDLIHLDAGDRKIDNYFNTGGLGVTSDWWPDLGLPGGRTFHDRLVAVNVPIDVAMGHGEHHDMSLFAPIASLQQLYDYGEQEVAERIASGATAEEARGEGFAFMKAFHLSSDVICSGTFRTYAKRVHANFPLKVEFVPVQVHEPGSELAVGGLTEGDWVTDAVIAIVEDNDDPCILHLSCTVATNGEFTVQYRIIDPLGNAGPIKEIDVGITHVEFFVEEVAIPVDPNAGDGGGGAPDDLTGGDDGGDPDDFTDGGGGGRGDGPGSITGEAPEGYSGTYMLEIVSPNHLLDGSGFNVPYCTSSVDDLQLRGSSP